MTRAAASSILATLATAAISVSLLSGCEPSQAKSPTATTPLDEARASKVISDALTKENLVPLGPATADISHRKKVTVDVMVKGKKIGVVYLTPSDAQDLGDHPLLKRQELPGDPLRIERGTGQTVGMHFVVLYASDYLIDEATGEPHQQTAIAAENKLDRDVRDFVMIALREHWL